MAREETPKGLEALKRPDLIALASKLGIAGRYRMTKRTLTKTIVVTRIWNALPESPEILHRLEKNDLQGLCQLAGVKTNTRSKKAELVKAIQRTIVKKRSSETAGSDRPRIADEAIQDVSAEVADLPDSYGETRVILLPIHPYLIHVHWEVTPEDISRAKNHLGRANGQSRPVLRFYDITYILFDGTNAHNFFDVEIDLRTRNWYVHLWSPEKSYCVDLGFKTIEGLFFSIARSNAAQTPAAWPSSRTEARYSNGRTGAERIRTGDVIIEPETASGTTLPPSSKVSAPLPSASGFGDFRATNDFDLTELSEQKFAAGLFSSSNGKG